MLFLEGFFDAEGCVKPIKEKVRKTPKICLDICNTNHKILEIVRKILMGELGIKARYSNQDAYVSKDNHKRKKSYHLRIYKKDYIRKFFQEISTIKLTPNKKIYLKNWLNK